MRTRSLSKDFSHFLVTAFGGGVVLMVAIILVALWELKTKAIKAGNSSSQIAN